MNRYFTQLKHLNKMIQKQPTISKINDLKDIKPIQQGWRPGRVIEINGGWILCEYYNNEGEIEKQWFDSHSKPEIQPYQSIKQYHANFQIPSSNNK